MKAMLCGVLALAACRTYTPRPLDPEDILKTVEARRAAPEGVVVSLERATELMRAHNPRVREARAAYAVAQAVADVPTPRPNPSLDAGPLLLDGADVLWGAEASLGWAVVLGGTRRFTDDVNAIRAEEALVAAGGVEREEYLGLRADLCGLALAAALRRAREELAATAEVSRDTTRRLLEAGQASSLDFLEVELETQRAAGAALAAQEEVEGVRGQLAARIGVALEKVSAGALGPLPADVPGAGELARVMLRDHAGLARLKAAYTVAEKELRLEIARQYPSLTVGPSFERETDNRWGLGLGIELPVFDRNQPAIARAHARREEVRTAFETEVQRGLARIEEARARLVLRRKRLALMRERALPAAEAALENARRALDGGVIDTLRFLSVLRGDREARIEALEAERRVYEGWLELEAAVGAPLLDLEETQ